MKESALWLLLVWAPVLCLTEILFVDPTCSTCYLTIGSAIRAAAYGDTLLVKRGYYREGNLVLNKGLSILGSGDGSTILDARGHLNGFSIQASDVSIKGMVVSSALGSAISVDLPITRFNLENVVLTDSGTGISVGISASLIGANFTKVNSIRNIYGIDIRGSVDHINVHNSFFDRNQIAGLYISPGTIGF
jgi:hypothetical protein